MPFIHIYSFLALFVGLCFAQPELTFPPAQDKSLIISVKATLKKGFDLAVVAVSKTAKESKEIEVVLMAYQTAQSRQDRGQIRFTLSQSQKVRLWLSMW